MMLACATIIIIGFLQSIMGLVHLVYPLCLIEVHHMDIEKMEDMLGTRSIYFATDEVYAFPMRL